MTNHLYAIQGLAHAFGIADIADHKLGIGLQILGPRLIGMDLAVEIIEYAYFVAGGEQFPRKMGTDKAGTTRDQNF
jgi:hypothetical protein